MTCPTCERVRVELQAAQHELEILRAGRDCMYWLLVEIQWKAVAEGERAAIRGADVMLQRLRAFFPAPFEPAPMTRDTVTRP